MSSPGPLGRNAPFVSFTVCETLAPQAKGKSHGTQKATNQGKLRCAWCAATQRPVPWIRMVGHAVKGGVFRKSFPDSSCVSVDNFWWISFGTWYDEDRSCKKRSRDFWNCSPQLWQTMRGLYSSHDLTVLPTVLKKQPAAVPTVLTVPFPTRKTWVFTGIPSRAVREHSQNPKKSFPKHARRPHAGNWSKVSWKVQDSTWFNYLQLCIICSDGLIAALLLALVSMLRCHLGANKHDNMNYRMLHHW